jgi:hypothetical protein
MIGYQNIRLLADEYAKTGNFKVIVPDFFKGEFLHF